MNIRHTIVTTDEINDIVVVAEDGAISGIYFPYHWTCPDWSTFGEAVDAQDDAVLTEAGDQVRQYLRGKRTTFDFAIALHSNDFQ